MEQRKIAVFDSKLKLVAISSGIGKLAKIMGVGTGDILRAIRGDRICCNGSYFRYIPEDTIIDMDEIGKVDLIDFDLDWCGEDRLIYTTGLQKRNAIIRESEFAKIRDSRYKRYNFNNLKKRKNGNRNQGS